MIKVAGTDLNVFPLCLGGNVFGWTAASDAAFEVLDAYREGGGNFIDTADAYCHWVDGGRGGESEEIIGQWLTSREVRDEMVIATKVGRKPDRNGLRAENVRLATEEALARLQTDRIDILYAHSDDPDTPLEETLEAFDRLVKDGLVRYIAASNHTAERLARALEVSESNGLANYALVQNRYNLVERADYENDLQPFCRERGIACMPYFGLAAGFLTGKYRKGGPNVESPRAADAVAKLTPENEAILDSVRELAGSHGVPMASVALAWLAQQPTIAAPIASARSADQLAELMPMADLRLSDEEIAGLSR